MANKEIFYNDFLTLSKKNGTNVLGIDGGTPAYIYLRVSTSAQSEETASGFPRQLEHCHESAIRNGLSVTWENVYMDDSSGFEFVDRKMLLELINRIGTDHSIKNMVVEKTGRLSRNGEWQLGYLMSIFKRHHVNVIFWDEVHSRLELMLKGGIEQDEIEHAMMRMAWGKRRKAINGFVTSSVRAYGYDFFDTRTKTVVQKPGKFPTYVRNPQEWPVVYRMYEAVAIDMISMQSLCDELDATYPPPGRAKRFDPSWVSHVIHNPVYKGMFSPYRFETLHDPIDSIQPGLLMTGGEDTGKQKKTKIVLRKDTSDAFYVPIDDKIVSPELWKMANDRLATNAEVLRTRKNSEFLLTGLVRCGLCGRSVSGSSSWSWSGTNASRIRNHFRRYRCNFSFGKHGDCDLKHIQAKLLENTIWDLVRETMLHPETVLQAIDDILDTDQNKRIADQITYLENEIKTAQDETETLFRLVSKKFINDEEFGTRKLRLDSRIVALRSEILVQRGNLITAETVATQREFIMRVSESARNKIEGEPDDVPFELKQRLIGAVIQKIIVDGLNVTIQGNIISGSLVMEPLKRGSAVEYQTRVHPDGSETVIEKVHDDESEDESEDESGDSERHCDDYRRNNRRPLRPPHGLQNPSI